MTVSYDVFTEAFLNKLTEHKFPVMNPDSRQAIVDGYIHRACSRFSEVCEYPITNGDDDVREFVFENMTKGELTEIVDIVSEGMLVQWMKPYVFMQSGLEPLLVTADHSFHSQAELLNRVTATYAKCEKDFANMILNYSYRHGDLTDLHQ